MTTADDYRARLIEAAQNSQTKQSAREMTDEELNNAICDSLGVPRGTQLTDEQLEMLIESHKLRRQALNHRPESV